MEAILLVGGKGTRLRPLTAATPKAMLPLAGVPFVAHQLTRARLAGIDHVVLATSYRAELFEERLGDGAQLGLALSYAVEPRPLGTGGAVRNGARRLRTADPVVVLNGDVLGALDLPALVWHHRAVGAELTLHVRKVADPRAYGVVTVTPDARVRGFEEKSDRPSGRLVNAGTYVFDPAVLLAIPDGPVVSLERDTFPALVRDGRRVAAYRDDDSYWLDIGTPGAYRRGNCDVVLGRVPSQLSGVPRPALAGPSARIAPDAVLTGGTVVGERAAVGSGARLEASVVLDDAAIGAGAQVTDSVIGYRARIRAGAVVTGQVVPDDGLVPARR
jgi:mannose-1-phosphate guanylyltransferase